MSDDARQFPIHPYSRSRGGPDSVPWVMLAPHEARALKNHGQTLERLAERGGLSVGEVLAVLEDRPWKCAKEEDEFNHDEAVLCLRERVEEWHAAQRDSTRPAP